jgi:WD40-like Beta Propeller Repeat
VAILLVAACSTPPATTPPGETTGPTPAASTPLTTPAGSITAPSGSPGASLGAGPGRIVFARYKPARNISELYTVNPDGSGLRELLSNWTYAIQLPRWSWQGDLILAYGASTPTILPTDAVHHIHLAPSISLKLVCAAWSPDEKAVACEGWRPSKPGLEGVYTLPSETSAFDPYIDEHPPAASPTRLTTAAKGTHDVPGDYSADGRIVFVRTTYAVLGLGEIWVAKADGSEAQKLTDTLSTYRVAWSHDGRWIVGEREGVLELFDLTDLTKDPARITIAGGKATEPRFSPDGTRIVFVYTKTGAATTSIESVALDGSGVVQITSGEVDRSPDWGTPGF